MATNQSNSLTKKAAAVLTFAAPGRLTTAGAMKIVGFSTPECEDTVMQKKVRRIMKRKEAPLASLPESGPAVLPSIVAPVQPLTKAIQEMNEKNIKKMRLTSRQAQAVRKQKASEAKAHQLAVKETTILFAMELQNESNARERGETYKKKSAETIAAEYNEKHKTSISGKTIRNHIKKGHAGRTPQKPGVKGTIPQRAFKALCSALETYAKLTAHHPKSNHKTSKTALSKRVNSVVNSKDPTGKKRQGLKLIDRILMNVADTLDLNEVDKIEMRRKKYTTYTNVNMYFDSLREFLIENKFASVNEECNNPTELVYGLDQPARIVSVDESAIAIDNTDCGKGGRPALQFYDPYLQDAPNESCHKSSYHASGMFGATASGQVLAPHFILPTDAKKDNQQIPFEFVEHFKDIHCQVTSSDGRKQHIAVPATFGMNEKGSMTKEELENYFMNNFRLHFPDSADVPLKRVLVLIDGGPGRTNKDMLVKLRLMGFLLFPAGPPNTTHLLQIMDQLFGALKTKFYNNFDILWDCRMNLRRDNPLFERITRLDIGQLLFGGELSNGKILEDTFNTSFTQDKIERQWAKVGIVPFTRNALNSKRVQHEIVRDVEGNIDTDADPKAAYLQALSDQNELSCSVLDSFGYNGDLLRQSLPVFSSAKRQEQVTVAHTRERQEAIQKSKTLGSLFLVTGGSTLNGDDYFIADERKNLEDAIKSLKAEKKERKDAASRESAALTILECENKKLTNDDLKTLIAWKSGRPCPSKISRLGDRKALWAEVKDNPPIRYDPWTDNDQQKLDELEKSLDGIIPTTDTELGRQREVQKHLLLSQVPTLTGEDLRRLKANMTKDQLRVFGPSISENDDVDAE